MITTMRRSIAQEVSSGMTQSEDCSSEVTIDSGQDSPYLDLMIRRYPFQSITGIGTKFNTKCGWRVAESDGIQES